MPALSLGMEPEKKGAGGLSGLPEQALEWREAKMNIKYYLRYVIPIGIATALLGLCFGLMSKNDLVANASFISLMFVGLVMWFDVLFQVVFFS